MSSIEEEELISAGKSREKEDEQSTRKFVERFKDLFRKGAAWLEDAKQCYEEDKDFKDKVRLIDKTLWYMLTTLYINFP